LRRPARRDGLLRQRLAGLVDTPAQSAHDRALSAALASIPPEFAHACVVRSQLGTRGAGSVETLQVQLDAVEVTPRSRVHSVVACTNERDASDRWHCLHEIVYASQSVAGQHQPVQVLLPAAAALLTEAFVDRLAAAVHDQLPRFLPELEAPLDVTFTQVAIRNGVIVGSASVGAEHLELSISARGEEVRVLSVTRRPRPAEFPGQ
jgi:hypothetical protein